MLPSWPLFLTDFKLHVFQGLKVCEYFVFSYIWGLVRGGFILRGFFLLLLFWAFL